MCGKISQGLVHAFQFFLQEYLLHEFQVGMLAFGHGFGIAATLIRAINFYRQLFTGIREISANVVNEVIALRGMSYDAQVLQLASMQIMLRSSLPQFSKDLIQNRLCHSYSKDC